MRSFRTSVVLAAAVAALSWSGVSQAQDTAKSGKDTSSESSKSTTKTKSKSTTKSTSEPTTGTTGTGTTGTGSTGTGMTGTGTTEPSMGTGTTGTGTSSGTMDMTGTSTTTTTTTPPPSTGTMPSTTTTPPPTYGTEPYPPPAYPPPTTSTTTTTAAEYQETAGAEKAGYEVRPNRYMLGTGAVLLVGPYVAGAIVAASNSNSYDDKLYWPVAGPWIDLAERPCNNFNCGTAEDWNQILLVGSGIAQGAGVILMLTSLAVPEKHESKVATAREKSLAASKPSVHVTPITVRGGSGIGAVGTF